MVLPCRPVLGPVFPRKTTCGPPWVHVLSYPYKVVGQHTFSQQPMRTPRLDRLTAGGHSFHPVYEVCGVCGMTRPQYEDNGKPSCAGRQSGFERFVIDPDDDEPDSLGG